MIAEETPDMPLPQHIRVRCAEEHPLIFERPESQPKAARNAMMLLTGFGWTIWLYLWRPVLTLLVWVFGVDVAHYQWVGLAGWRGLSDFALHTMPYGLALCAMLLLWASVNYVRFRGVDRRKERPLATLEADAAWTCVEPALLARGRQSKNLVCQHDGEGHLTGMLDRPEGAQPIRTAQEGRARQEHPAMLGQVARETNC